MSKKESEKSERESAKRRRRGSNCETAKQEKRESRGEGGGDMRVKLN